MDNVTVVMISFKNFKRTVFGEDRLEGELLETVDRTISMTMNESKMIIQEQSYLTKENIPPKIIGDENSSTAFNRAKLSVGSVKTCNQTSNNPLHIETDQSSHNQTVKSSMNSNL